MPVARSACRLFTPFVVSTAVQALVICIAIQACSAYTITAMIGSKSTHYSVPPSPTVSLVFGREPFVQINIDWSIAPYFNIYRARHEDGPWEKIIDRFPSRAHTAVDYFYPRDAHIVYYRITAVGTQGNESEPSAVSALDVNPSPAPERR